MSLISEHPRILVIDHIPLNRTTNNGIVKSNLLQDWPRKDLAQIFSSNAQPGFDVCGHCWVLKRTDILADLVRRSSSAELLPDGDDQNGDISYFDVPDYSSSLIERKLSVLPHHLRIIIGESIFRLPSVIPSPMRRWIEEFQPDILFSMMGSGAMLRTVVKASRLYDIPILPYFTDDWISSLYVGPGLSRLLLRRSMYNWFNECLKRAPIRLSISDAMSIEYTKRYGGEFKTFMNLVDKTNVGKAEKIAHSNEIIRLLYIGSLALERWQPLRDIGKALLKLGSEGIKAELLIYAFPRDIKKYGVDLNINPVMKIMGTANPDEVATIQRKADVLVHVESFCQEHRKYTKFSLSTKIPQYMISGNCIFAYGPREVASLKYLQDSGSGITVGERDPKLLLKVLRAMIKDRVLMQKTAKRAKMIAIKRNGGCFQRERFEQIVGQACSDWVKFKKMPQNK